MPDPVTNNLSLILMATGTASGAWGTVLNASMITLADAALGNTLSVPVSSSNVNLTTTQRQNLAFTLTGTLSGNINVTLPLSPNSTTQAVGGIFEFNNVATGAFGVTVKTIASGSLGVEVPQGVRSLLYSDGTHIYFADDVQNQVVTVSGNPNGNTTGSAGSVSTRASRVVNRATNEAYLCQTSGTAGSAVWTKDFPYSFASQGYLTASSDATNPILVSDSIGASTIYYTAYVGNNIFLNNGTSFAPWTIPSGQMSLVLTSGAQAANGIYDVMGFLNGTTVTVAFSPQWTTTAVGSCARGTGAGTPQLSRVNGVLVNAVAQSANNGATTYTIGTSKGTYLGSVAVDSSAGQVSCLVNYGQSRKWGIWNAYNRQDIYMRAGDSTSSWSAGATYPTFRASNNNANNRIQAFIGLPEESISAEFTQIVAPADENQVYLGIGQNSTTSPSGFQPTMVLGVSGTDLNDCTLAMTPANARFVGTLGLTNIQSLEARNSGTITMYGTEAKMLLTASWRG